MTSARKHIIDWAEQGRLDPGAVRDALAFAGVTPDAARWRRFIDALLLSLGSALIAAGVIFFLAYNWDGIGRFARFVLVEAVLAASIAIAWYAGLEKPVGKAALLLASLLTGALLALVGQTYQTGADPYELFAIWALLILPWTLASRVPALWLLVVALLNLAVALYFQAFRGLFGIVFGSGTLVWSLFVLNTAALVVWEIAAFNGAAWLKARWAARVLATASGSLATILGLWAIFESSDVGPLAFPACALWLGAAYFYYRHRERDLFVLAGGVLSVSVLVSAFLGDKLLGHAEAGGFLVIGLAVIGMSAAGAWWLKRIATERDE
jgi:uncharacterized membrane protein